jgi:hypothetical protein
MVVADLVLARALSAGSRARRRVAAAVLLAAGVLAAGCAGTSQPKHSALQQKIGTPGAVSATELRLRLYEIPQRLGGIIENSADRIRTESADPAVRRRALLWKADGIPALYTAALRPDPLVGALDLWVVVYQMDFYFEEGAGKDAFGLQQPIALGAVKKMVALVEATAELLTPDPALLEKRRTRVQAFARAHPIEGVFSSRETAVNELAGLAVDEDSGTLAAVGQATETLEDISLRLNAYVTLLPKLVRWEAEVAEEQATGRDNIGATLDDIHAIAEAASGAGRLLADIPGATREASGPIKELIDQERAVLMSEVERERLAVTEFITSEREAAMAAVSQERRAALASVGQERAAALAGIDALARRSIEDASTRARGMADYVFWRALVLIAAAAALFSVGYRIARGRRADRHP